MQKNKMEARPCKRWVEKREVGSWQAVGTGFRRGGWGKQVQVFPDLEGGTISHNVGHPIQKENQWLCQGLYSAMTLARQFKLTLRSAVCLCINPKEHTIPRISIFHYILIKPFSIDTA